VLIDTDPSAAQVVLIGKGDNVPQALLEIPLTHVLPVRVPEGDIKPRSLVASNASGAAP
jgi:hypothetical protein